MIAVAFGLTIAIVGIFYSRWLKEKSVILETFDGSDERSYTIVIKNLSEHPVTVVQAWVQLTKIKQIPIDTLAAGVVPGVILPHGGVWSWQFSKTIIPSGVNCDKMVRAKMMDGRILKSRRGEPPPYGGQWR